MTEFFTLRHNSFRTQSFPWIKKIVAGMRSGGVLCGVCSTRESDHAIGDIEVELEADGSSKWPSALGSGATVSLLIVSEAVLKDWEIDEVGQFPVGGEVVFRDPIPIRLRNVNRPRFYWLDGANMVGARLKEGSRPDVFGPPCPACGHTRIDVSATLARGESTAWPYVLEEWNGANLFKTTPTQGGVYFCTDAVVECARRRRHTNLRFVPIEAGDAAWSGGIDYLAESWPPPRHPVRRSEGKTLEEWIRLIHDPKMRWEARCALLDLGDDAFPAIPTLTTMLDDPDGQVRSEAALLLSQFRKRGARLGTKADAGATDHEMQFQATLGKPEQAS